MPRSNEKVRLRDGKVLQPARELSHGVLSVASPARQTGTSRSEVTLGFDEPLVSEERRRCAEEKSDRGNSDVRSPRAKSVDRRAMARLAR